MALKNKYFVRSRISEKKFRQIIRYFVVDLTANQISSLSGISRPTINKVLNNVRMCIAEFCEKEKVEVYTQVIKNCSKGVILPLISRKIDIEGQTLSQWIVLDYNFLIIHIFYDYLRQYYQLEDLWKKRSNGITKV